MNKKTALVYFFVIFAIFQFGWWLKLHMYGDLQSDEAYWFNLVYGLASLIGAVNGFFVVRRWGGFKSHIGKTIFFLSIGLFSEWIANVIWGYYNIALRTEIPYPSEADIFFLAIIPIYAVAMYYLALAAGAKMSLRSYKGKIVAIAVPLVALTAAFWLFVREGLDFSNPVKFIFDVGYPLGEAITASVALLAYYLTREKLGGVLKKLIIVTIGAYTMQFIADYGFLITVINETYYNANWVDMMYALAVTSMPIAIVYYDIQLERLNKTLTLKDLNSEQQANQIQIRHKEKYEKILYNMIKEQYGVIGDFAVKQADTVQGLSVGDKLSSIELSGDPTSVFRELASNYEQVFGQVSIEALRDSARKTVEKEEYDINELELNF